MATDAPNLDGLYDAAGHKYNIDPLRLKAHAVAETNERADVPSQDGRSYGFGQFTPETWRRVMPGVPLSARGDPETAIEAMARLLARNDDAHRDANGNVDLMASTAAYNGSGPQADAYAKRVQGIYGQLDAAGGLHLTGGQSGRGKAPANDDDAFGQTLKGQPAVTPDAKPQQPAAEDAFGQTLKGGPAETPAPEQPNSVLGPLPGASSVTSDAPMPTLPSGLPADPDETAPAPSGWTVPSAADVAGYGKGLLGSVQHGLTFGLDRPINALSADLLGNTAVGQKLTAAIEAQKAFEAQHPLAAGTAETVGALPTYAGGEGLLARSILPEITLPGLRGSAGSVATAAARNALVSAVQGGGMTDGDLNARIDAARQSAILGAVFGGGATASARAIEALRYGQPAAALTGVDRPYLTPGASADIAASRPNLLRADANETSATGVPTFTGGPAMAVRPDAALPAPAGPSPGMGAPQPQSGGAAASTAAQATMTPDEILANRHVAEKDWLNRTIQPGVEDNRELVPGNNPTLAQREQNAATSREQKSLTQQNPQLAQEEKVLLDEHNQNRQNMYQEPDLAGSTVLLDNAEKAAKDKLDAGLNAAFANKKPANAQPVVDLADKFLAGREGKRQAIETEVKGVRARLFDEDGNVEHDPELLWGVREHINDVLSKENQRQNPVSGRAQSVLIQMRDQLDRVIDPAAPGFTAAIKGYAEDMKAPDVMRALQDRYNGLHDAQGRMQFSRFHSLMRDIVDARKPGAALSPFQHITDAQMQRLMALHDDLKRAATAQDLAAARGSDTAQNLWDAAKTYARGRGTAAINMIPYVGGLVRHGQEAYAPYAEMKARQNALKRGVEMLRPPPDKYPTRNPLEGP